MRNHYAREIWQNGGILIGAAVVAFTIALERQTSNPLVFFGLTGLAVGTVMSWLWLSARHHPFLRLHDLRLLEIEELLSGQPREEARAESREQFIMQHHLSSDLFGRGTTTVNGIPIRVSNPRHWDRLGFVGSGFIVAFIILAILVWLSLHYVLVPISP